MKHITFSLIKAFRYSIMTLTNNVWLFLLLIIITQCGTIVNFLFMPPPPYEMMEKAKDVLQKTNRPVLKYINFDAAHFQPSAIQAFCANLVKKLHLDRSIGFTITKNIQAPNASAQQETHTQFKWIFFDYKSRGNRGEYNFSISLLGLFLALLTIFLILLSNRIALDYYDYQTIRFQNSLYATIKHYPTALMALLLLCILLFLGFVCFLIPLIVLFLRYFFVTVVIVDDQHRGIRNAFSVSAQCTRGVKGHLFLWTLCNFFLLVFKIFIPQSFALLLSTLIAPINILAYVYAYRTLLTQQISKGGVQH